MKFANKTIVISGASRGIGASAAREFASQGANVVLLARSTEALETLADEIGEKALALACDVADYAAVTLISRFSKRRILCVLFLTLHTL